MKEIASPTTTQYILNKYDLFPKKKYGQNFLVDKTIVEKIVAQGQLDVHSAVIEIGPGIGALTQILAKYAGYVRSYEIDPAFLPVYEEFFKNKNIDIIFEDFLKVDLNSLKEIKNKYQKIVVVANLPYYITSQIIEKVVTESDFIDEMIIMVQKEVALKFTGSYKSPLLLTIQDRGAVEYLFTVSKNVFIPAPHVDSAILKITLNSHFDDKLYHLLKLAFRQRRKTLYNNLKKEYDQILNILERCHIDPQLRCEQLTLQDYKNITSLLS